MKVHPTALVLACLLLPALRAQDTPASRPAGEEVYQPTKVPTPIRWERSLEAAHARSKVDGKPVVAYFTFDT
ncbi:MAG: hypothetical protein R3F30_15945 [Planctomycetota bacterium]